MRRLAYPFALLLLASCGSPTPPTEMAAPADLATGADAAAADLAVAADLAPPADLAQGADLLVVPDLAAPPDLAVAPDLAVPPDLAAPADLVPPPPDLTPPPDLRMPPSLTLVSPPSGPSNGGVQITLTGGNFDPGAKVQIAGVDCFAVKVVSAKEITCTIPALPGAFGPVAVTVVNPDTLKASRNDLFRYYHGTVNFDVKSLPVGSNPEGLAVGELTGDGVLDLVAVNRKSNNFHVFVGAQDGSFSLQPGSPISVGGSSPGGGVIANFDGKPGGELVVPLYLSRALAYFLNVGGKLTATTSLSSASTYGQAAAVADVDKDGILDVVASTQSSGNPVNGYAIVHYGDGKGAFPVTSTYGVFQSNLTHIVVGSFNKRDDDVPDLATVRNDTCNVLVFLGTGQRDFPAKVNPFAVPVGKDPSDLITGDWNGDGRTDLAVANSGKFPSTCANPATDNVGLLLGTGDGGFSTMKTFPAHQNPRSLGAADFNRDGKLDLVAGNNGSSDISLLLGRGDGTFLPPQHIPGGSGVNRLVVADFNGDQKPDVATVDNGPDPGTLSIYLNIAK